MADFAATSDRALLDLHRDGDPDAFGEIVRRHRDRMWAVALRTLGDPEEAADAVQDALVSAYRGAAAFRGDSAITTWLHRVVVNACLDRVRRKSIRRTVPLPEPESDEDRGGREVAVANDPTDEADLAMDVAAALATLPTDQRAALVLVDLQGYPVEEAGKILGVPTGTVKSRCARGRARLLPLLSHLRQGNENGAACVKPGMSAEVVPLHRGAMPATGGPPRPTGSAEGADQGP